MLILTRKKGEEIIIGRGTHLETRLVVLECKAGGVTLGFDGSRDLSIMRKEVRKCNITDPASTAESQLPKKKSDSTTE